jgi:hypothetical protein
MSLTVQVEEKCRDEIREKLRIIREDKKLLDQYKRLGFSQSEDIDHQHNCKDRKKVIEGDECKTCGGLRVLMFKNPENELIFCDGDPDEKYRVYHSKDETSEVSAVTLGELDKAMVELYDQIDEAVKNINHKFKGKLKFDLTHPELNIVTGGDTVRIDGRIGFESEL